MNTVAILAEISKLEIAEQILLLQEAWDKLTQAQETPNLPRWQQEELDRRLADAGLLEELTPSPEFHAQLRELL